MKIVHFLNHCRRANGHVAVAIDLACEQVRVGHDVTMVCGVSDFDPLLEAHGVKRIVLAETSGRLRLPKMAWRFLSIVKRCQPDIVHAHMVYAALAAALARPFAKFRLVTSIHNSFDRQALLMGVGDRVIAVSNAVNREMRARGIAERKLRTVHNGTIGGPRRPSGPARIRRLMHPAVISVGGLHPRKGVADLIDAFARVHRRHPDAHLYLIGDGPLRADYEAQAARLDLGEVAHFEGYHDDPREFLGDADIFVLASHAEPFGLVTIEAREMGCAIIVTDVGGSPEAMGGGDKGILVPPRDSERLADAIARLLENKGERERLAQAASTDLEHCTVERMNEDTLAIYAELVDEGGRRLRK